MNCHFIDYIIENIFSDRPLIADTLFHMDGVMILAKPMKRPPAYICIVWSYALELSWVFRMCLNMYHADITEYNRARLIHIMAKEARYYSVMKYPKQAVMLAAMNAAEYWFTRNFPQKAKILHHEGGITEVYVD